VKPFSFLLLFVLSPFYGSVLFAQACDSSSAPVVECRSYFQSNQIKSIYKWKDGQRHGLWVDFKANGLFKRRTRYRKGIRIWQMDYISEKEVVITNKKGDIKRRKSCGCR
jgi:antitoxin component YwqK of YwqJK toxin-antitoxin module